MEIEIDCGFNEPPFRRQHFEWLRSNLYALTFASCANQTHSLPIANIDAWISKKKNVFSRFRCKWFFPHFFFAVATNIPQNANDFIDNTRSSCNPTPAPRASIVVSSLPSSLTIRFWIFRFCFVWFFRCCCCCWFSHFFILCWLFSSSSSFPVTEFCLISLLKFLPSIVLMFSFFAFFSHCFFLLFVRPQNWMNDFDLAAFSFGCAWKLFSFFFERNKTWNKCQCLNDCHSFHCFLFFTAFSHVFFIFFVDSQRTKKRSFLPVSLIGVKAKIRFLCQIIFFLRCVSFHLMRSISHRRYK